MTAHIDYPKPPVSEGVNNRLLVATGGKRLKSLYPTSIPPISSSILRLKTSFPFLFYYLNLFPQVFFLSIKSIRVDIIVWQYRCMIPLRKLFSKKEHGWKSILYDELEKSS
jgi:hypothetical protein